MDGSKSNGNDIKTGEREVRSSDAVERVTTRQAGEIEEVLGYAPVYRRAFSSITSFCLTVAITSPTSALLVVASYQIIYGGYWGLIWGWIIPGFIFAPQAMAVAMLSSSMPVNGAFYWYAAALAPPRFSRFVAFLTGWTTILSGVTSIASFAYAIASPLALFISKLDPGWAPTNPQIMGITFAITILWIALACSRLENISWLVLCNTAVTCILSTLFVIGIPAARAAQHMPFAPAKDVFTVYTNSGDWGRTVAVCLTFLSSAWVVSAWALPAYSVEGTKNASKSVPKAIMSSYYLMVLLGLIMCIVCAFCIPDMALAAADETGYPLYTLIYESWGLDAASAYLIISTVNLLVGASSMLFSYACNLAAFARDGGVPFASFIAQISPSGSVPINSTLVIGLAGLLCLIIGLSPMASEIIYSLAVVMAVINYMTPNILVLCCPSRFTRGPWHYGKFTFPVFAWAVASQIFLIVIESFPTIKNWDASTFNYQWVIAFGALLLVCLLWLVDGKRFRGVSMELIERHISENQ